MGTYDIVFYARIPHLGAQVWIERQRKSLEENASIQWFIIDVDALGIVVSHVLPVLRIVCVKLSHRIDYHHKRDHVPSGIAVKR